MTYRPPWGISSAVASTGPRVLAMMRVTTTISAILA